MKPLIASVERVSVTTGLFTLAALVIYFFIMKLIGLEKMIEFRFFNFFILLGGASYSINKIIKQEGNYHNDDFYLKGFGTGILTALIAVFGFAFFISVYLTYIDRGLMSHIQSTTSLGEYINGFTVFLILFLEGTASSLIIVFCAMQYFKSRISTHLAAKNSA